MTTDEQREAFEAWAKTKHASVDRYATDDTDNWPGHYKNYSVELAWLAWQAAIEHAKGEA